VSPFKEIPQDKNDFGGGLLILGFLEKKKSILGSFI
jgi:hypothetical protein